jgi:hypothetical protein
MTTTPAPERPDWIVPGADVLVVKGFREQTIARTKIAKVYKRYFTVELNWCATDRFDLERQEHRSPGMWTSDVHVYPIDSDKARELIDQARRRRLVSKAREACDRWSRATAGVRELRLAAIAALQAVEDDE